MKLVIKTIMTGKKTNNNIERGRSPFFRDTHFWSPLEVISDNAPYYTSQLASWLDTAESTKQSRTEKPDLEETEASCRTLREIQGFLWHFNPSSEEKLINIYDSLFLTPWHPPPLHFTHARILCICLHTHTHARIQHNNQKEKKERI